MSAFSCYFVHFCFTRLRIFAACLRILVSGKLDEFEPYRTGSQTSPALVYKEQ